MTLDRHSIALQAREEFAAEQRRQAVDAEKARLRAKAGRPLLERLADRLLPFTVTVKRKPK